MPRAASATYLVALSGRPAGDSSGRDDGELVIDGVEQSHEGRELARVSGVLDGFRSFREHHEELRLRKRHDQGSNRSS